MIGSSDPKNPKGLVLFDFNIIYLSIQSISGILQWLSSSCALARLGENMAFLKLVDSCEQIFTLLLFKKNLKMANIRSIMSTLGTEKKAEFGSDVLNEVLDYLAGEKWSKLRHYLSPLFTTAKLKQMSDVMSGSTSEFMNDLKSECDENGRLKIDCRKRISTWLIDLFALTTLGIRLENAKNPDNKFAEAFREMMGEKDEYNLLYSLSLSFPFLSRFAPTFNDQPTKLIESTFRQIISSRKQQTGGVTQNSKDFLDHTKEFKDLGIGENTIIAQAINFFLGGYDTSTTTLSHLLLALADNPECQEKMHDEIMSVLKRQGNSEINHDTIHESNIPYIQACIYESLRLAPPFTRPERICTKDWSYKGYSIKKGTHVMLASWAANRTSREGVGHNKLMPMPSYHSFFEMEVLGSIRGLLNPKNPQGLLLFGTLITLSVFNPFLGIFAMAITIVLAQARENYGVLEACGIPVVKPTLFLGSESNLHKTVVHFADVERYKKFGGIWGSYVGRIPEVYIADPELIRLIFVKDFVHFGDRKEADFGSEVLNEILDYLPGEKWSKLRHYLSPLFTTAKLKQMSDVMAESATEFMDDLKSECDEKGQLKIDCRKRLSAWLIDLFARTTLGIRLEDAKNPDNKFAEAFREMMGEKDEYNLLYTLSLSFPFLSRFAPTFIDEPTKLIESTLRQIISSRKKQQNSKDFLDVLVDLWGRVNTKEFKDLGLTENTILAQAIDFFLGGYETSSTVLSHLLLALAENPDCQEKMHEEIMSVLKRQGNAEINHDSIHESEVPYIQACIYESLRLAPSIFRPERICTKDWNYKGYSIKKGTRVMLAAWAANRNPEVYPDPEAFKPERFLPGNKGSLESYAFTSFGFGPRNCIGMRFAYENLKLFAANLAKEFRVVKRADTEMKYKKCLLLVGFSPLYVDLQAEAQREKLD
ncbi:Lithocholate 6-beta-hydroxylase [Orchesella cincta]|uniref:Lithocholate 6-beta-hydroxylase n=1 Tax=Orchesella cincta TaxID=48709 RepID=A0A1D2MSQ7_ORCCI|nr:Lithocholate 6-beta-hydroxylase [Orchesella cincta]